MDIGSMLQNLSADDLSKLKETASRFFGGNDGGAAALDKTPAESGQFDLSGIDTQVLENVARISSMMSQKDTRSDFLMSLKPLLSEGRQKKADEAAKMLKMMKVLGAMRGNGA